MSWTQAICDRCWRQREGERTPVRIASEHREREVCCWCGAVTRSGIYVRAHASQVPFPRQQAGGA